MAIVNSQYVERYLIPSVLFVLALSLRLHGLGQRSMWNDEMFTLKLVRHPWNDFWYAVFFERTRWHPPFFFVLEKVVVQVLGTTEFALRFLPAVSGALTVPVLYVLLLQRYKTTTAILGATLLAISTYHIAYSQEARPYSLAILITSLAATLLVAPTTRKFVWIALINLVGLYTHYWYGLVMIALLVVPSTPALRKHYLATCIVSGVLFIPQLFVLGQQSKQLAEATWWCADPPRLQNLWWTFLAFCSVRFMQASAMFEVSFVVQIVVSCAAAVGTALAWKHGRVYVLLVLVPVCMGFLISLALPQFYVWYRYPIIVLPFFLGMLAVGIDSLKGNFAKALLVVLLVASSGFALVRYQNWEKGNMKSVAAYVESVSMNSGVAIIRPWYLADLFEYYYRGFGKPMEETYDTDSLQLQLHDVNRIVLVSQDTPNNLRDWLGGHYRLVERKAFPGEKGMGVEVDVYAVERCDPKGIESDRK